MPRTIFRDPFRAGSNVIVMCDCYQPPSVGEDPKVSLKPIPTNTRHACMKAMEKVRDEEPWFGIEQVCMASLTVMPASLPSHWSFHCIISYQSVQHCKHAAPDIGSPCRPCNAWQGCSLLQSAAIIGLCAVAPSPVISCVAMCRNTPS